MTLRAVHAGLEVAAYEQPKARILQAVGVTTNGCKVAAAIFVLGSAVDRRVRELDACSPVRIGGAETLHIYHHEHLVCDLVCPVAEGLQVWLRVKRVHIACVVVEADTFAKLERLLQAQEKRQKVELQTGSHVHATHAVMVRVKLCAVRPVVCHVPHSVMRTMSIKRWRGGRPVPASRTVTWISSASTYSTGGTTSSAGQLAMRTCALNLSAKKRATVCVAICMTYTTLSVAMAMQTGCRHDS